MLKLLSIGIVVLLTGCAGFPQQHIDTQCDKVGAYARSVATLRDMGVTLPDIDSFTGEPVAVTFPFQRIKQEAFYLKTKNPADTYTNFYNQCTTVGYNNLLEDMKRMEEDRINSLKPPPKIEKQQKKRHVVKKYHKTRKVIRKVQPQ